MGYCVNSDIIKIIKKISLSFKIKKINKNNSFCVLPKMHTSE